MPAILSKTVETSTTTGTGNFTLSGAATTLYGPNARTFSAALGGVDYSFYYDIFHQTLAEFERGIGYLSGGALVRSLVIESSNSNDLVNFSAGDKVVMSAAVPDDLKLEPMNLHTSTAIRKGFFGRHVDSSLNLTGSRIYFMPYANFKDADMTAIGFNVTTAGTATHVARVGIFEKTAMRVYKKVIDFGTIAIDSTGAKLIVSSFNLPAGSYFVAICSQSGSVSASEPAFWNNWGGSSFSNNGGCWDYIDGVSPTGAFASTYTATLAPIVNQAQPVIVMRTATGLYAS